MKLVSTDYTIVINKKSQTVEMSYNCSGTPASLANLVYSLATSEGIACYTLYGKYDSAHRENIFKGILLNNKAAYAVESLNKITGQDFKIVK